MATMGKLARADPEAGWRAWERQTVLGQIDREGRRGNLDKRKILRYEIVSIFPNRPFLIRNRINAA